jgi:hypothetical protein
MSLLTLRARPIVAFDVQNPDHRGYFREFNKRMTWGHCPVRFMAEDLNVDLVTYISRKMLAYYIDEELTNDNKRKIRTKSKSKSSLSSVR